MNTQTTIFDAIAEATIPVHEKENNRESQDYLNENRDRIIKSCRKVFDRLMRGERLTVVFATLNGISSLPRRAMDLEAVGFLLNKPWVYVDGKKSHKEWFMTPEQIEFNKRHKPEVKPKIKKS